jgi:hypothetical protein
VVVNECVTVETPVVTPVTVKDCAVDQLPVVNVNPAVDTVATVVVPLEAVTVTSAVG